MAEVALQFPFALDPLSGSIVVTTDQTVIWSNRVRMVLETLLGERVMRPTYGTSIPKALFNTASAMSDTIEKEVRRVFVDQLPLLEMVSVSTSLDTVSNIITAEVVYKLPNKTTTSTAAGVMVISDTNPPYEELSQ